MDALTQLVSATTDGVFCVDNRQRIVLWNRGAKEVLGYTEREVEGRRCFNVVPDRKSCTRCSCGPNCPTFRAAQEGRPFATREMWARTKFGRRLFISMNTMLLPDRWRNRGLLLHVFRDCTRQKELEDLVREMMDRASGSIGRRYEPDDVDEPAHDAISLTEREREILRLLSLGSSTKGIARKLGISQVTVRNHIQSVLGKLGVHSRLEAVTFSLRNGLL